MTIALMKSALTSLLPAYAALLLLSFLSCTRADHDLETEYTFSAALHNDYKLYWSYDLNAKTIRFAVRVRTEGWVGFGLSPNGQMPGSDVVIGWVTDQGDVIFHDRFAEERITPAIDDSQDWILEFGEEKDGYTVLGFRRSITSCDPKDLDIETDTSRVVWSWHSSDPQDASSVPRHQFKGTASLNLLGGLNNPPPTPPDSDSFAITMETVTIPSDKDTTYWCHALQLPQKIRDTKRYVYKIAPKITEGSTPYVHHMLIYLCTGLDHTVVGQSSECDSAHIQIRECRGGETIGGWAVGGTEFLFPEDVALGVGGPGSREYAVIEMHYDNPDLIPGVEDSSGMEFFYSNTPPEHEAAVLPVGHTVTPTMIIPPNTDNYVIEGICPGLCTEQFFPPNGITVFGSGLHTHIYGHGLRLQHFRKNEECGVLEELEPINEDLRYDFNYQQFSHLSKRIKVMPGDSLVLQCFYRTTDTDRPVLGGESTRDEMCVGFFYYYPRVDLSFCASLPSTESFKPFADSYIEESKRDAFLTSLDKYNKTEFVPILETVEWNPEAVKGLENSVLNNPQTFLCFSENGPPIIGQENIPRSECPYEAADVCTGFQPKTCCERVNKSDKTPTDPDDSVAGGGKTTLCSFLVTALCWLFFQLKL